MTAPNTGREALDLTEAKRKIEIAIETLGHLCTEAWHWEIPANEERDTDLRIGAAIQVASALLSEVEALRAAQPPEGLVWVTREELGRLTAEAAEILGTAPPQPPEPAPGMREAAFKAGFKSGAMFHATFHGWDNAAADREWKNHNPAPVDPQSPGEGKA